jgi:hypothetical protein
MKKPRPQEERPKADKQLLGASSQSLPNPLFHVFCLTVFQVSKTGI